MTYLIEELLPNWAIDLTQRYTYERTKQEWSSEERLTTELCDLLHFSGRKEVAGIGVAKSTKNDAARRSK